MTHLVAAVLASVTPAPSDYLLAAADLTAPADAPVLASRSPRMRLAVLAALRHLDALDPDAPDIRWFGPGLSWESELTLARGVVARVRTCPPLSEDWLPGPTWFAAESAAYSAAAADWRRAAAEHLARVEWEADRTEALHAWARYMNATADAYSELSYRFAAWGGSSWSRPRRVVLAEVRELVGEECWRGRRWPD